MTPASAASEGDARITHVLVRVERGVAEAPAGDERHDERTGSGHLVVELVMPFVAGQRLGDAPFYAY